MNITFYGSKGGVIYTASFIIYINGILPLYGRERLGGAQWSTEPTGGAKIGKFKFIFLARIWVIGWVLNLSGKYNVYLLHTKSQQSARFLLNSDIGFFVFHRNPKALYKS